MNHSSVVLTPVAKQSETAPWFYAGVSVTLPDAGSGPFRCEVWMSAFLGCFQTESNAISAAKRALESPERRDFVIAEAQRRRPKE